MTGVALHPLALGPEVLDALPLLEASLGDGAALLPYAAGAPAPQLPDPLEPPRLPRDLSLVVGTSGSTGTPKRALLTSGALRASAAATRARLVELTGDDGSTPWQWLLALPPQHIAGMQVLYRSVLERTRPVVAELSAGFTPVVFTSAVARLDPAYRQVTSLVPTQVSRLLDDPLGQAALRALDAVLVGGSALAPELRRRAEQAGVRLVATYGMSETSGGCVYDGSPLDGCGVELDADGRILLRGPVLARGYLGRRDLTDDAFGTDTDGVRWFRTDDLGHVGPDGRLHVDGRIDDVIITGGLKVPPRLVEEAVIEHVAGVSEVAVVGVPDPTWGQAVAVVAVLHPRAVRSTLEVRDLRAALRGAIPDHALPRRVLVVPALPARGPGKPDRRALAALVGDAGAHGWRPGTGDEPGVGE